MKIEYRKQIDSETAPWQLLTNMDELLWNGIYNLRVTDDDGTHSLPFRFANDDTVTLVVKDHAHEGMLENGRTIVQTITRVERSTGSVLSYTRTRYNSNGTPTWTYWTLATEDDAVIEIPKATPVSLGGVIIGRGLAVDADGKLSVAGMSIGEEYLTSALNDKINVAATKANATDLFVQNSGLVLHYGALLQDDAPYPGTDLRVHTDKILSGGEQLVVNDGYVISALKIFDGEQEIAYANNLSESRYTLDAKGLHYQFEFSKLNMTPFTNDELSQVIKVYHRRPIVWSSTHHINHFVAAGVYNIVGERTNSADGLPIANAASGYSINACLMVLDSSIPAGSKESDKCITQILALSNRVGGYGDIYVRTGRAADTAYLIAGNGWSAWGKLLQNVEVGQTTSLDAYIDNGIYSGVYTNGTTLFETFVMVVINNYAVAAVTGTARNITQVKYAVDTNGAFCYHVRNGQGSDNVEWGDWRDLDAVTTARIQDGAVTAEKLSADVRGKVEKIPFIEQNSAKEKTALLNGDTVVGLAREVYSRQGKTDTSTFLKRTTAGGTSISDGVATVKQIGGNIVKNMIDSVQYTNVTKEYIQKVENGIATTVDGNSHMVIWGFGTNPYIAGHIYYCNAAIYNENAKDVTVALKADGTGIILSAKREWLSVSLRQTITLSNAEVTYRPFMSISVDAGTCVHIKKWIIIDLTEMFGAGKEPTKEQCDKMFGAMDALPQGLTVARPTGLKSIGYNQCNPANIIKDKTITENAIADHAGYNIAVVECLPCKVGAGENNGYVIGYGEGDDWSDEGVEVYLTPLNPFEADGELYMHKLEKDATYGTYVPQIKGYLLVVTPVADKLCAHFLWSGDRAKTDYEEYIESNVTLPIIPQMSEWGLAGFSVNGTIVQDVIDLEQCKYIKRVGRVDLGSLTWSKTSGGNFYAKVPGKGGTGMFADKYTVAGSFFDGQDVEDMTICTNMNDFASVLVKDTSYANADTFRQAVAGTVVYYELASHEEYQVMVRTAPNYIGSDYGVECFTGSQIPLSANILFYMRSLVSETRNFLDRLMSGLGESDVTIVADKITEIIIQAKGYLFSSEDE